MLRLASLALVAALLCCAQARADEDARAHFLGDWQGTGTFYDTKYSKAGPSTMHTTCGWQLETTYLVCAQTFQGPGGAGQALSIYTRNDIVYGFLGVDPDGKTRNVSMFLTPRGEIVYSSSFDESDGTHVTIRTVNAFPSPDVEDWRVEYSVDSGKKWTRMADGVQHRTAPDAHR